MSKNQKSDMNPRDRLNDEGQYDFPRSLKAKLHRRDEYRRLKYGSIENQREAASELTADLDRAISAQKYRLMWVLAFVSCLASVASAAAAIVAILAK